MKKASAGDYYLSADGTKSYVRVDVYVYIDGNDATVNTNNAVNLAMATISLLFSVDAVKAA